MKSWSVSLLSWTFMPAASGCVQVHDYLLIRSGVVELFDFFFCSSTQDLGVYLDHGFGLTRKDVIRAPKSAMLSRDRKSVV